MNDDIKLIAHLFAIVLRDQDILQIQEALKVAGKSTAPSASTFQQEIERVLRDRYAEEVSL